MNTVILNVLLHAYHDNPELIDNSPVSAPSKRIIKAIEGSRQYRYNKPTTGATVTKAIGMEVLTSQCHHFGDWVEHIRSIQ